MHYLLQPPQLLQFCLHSSWINIISNQNLHDHLHKSQVKHIKKLHSDDPYLQLWKKDQSRYLILPVSTTVWYIVYLNVEIRKWSYFQRLKPILKCLKTSHGNIAVTVLSTVYLCAQNSFTSCYSGEAFHFIFHNTKQQIDWLLVTSLSPTESLLLAKARYIWTFNFV